jgi:uncharacterized OsmC-like protein
MKERSFKMRVFCDYQQPDNAVAGLSVEVFEENEWQTFELEPGSPGFLIFVYSVLSCQQMHLRLGCTDRGLQLASADGDIEITTTEDWIITRLRVSFTALLSAGQQSDEDTDIIIKRMKNCPVSRNLVFAPQSEITLEFQLK